MGNETQIREMRDAVGTLTTAVAELLTWAQQVEAAGVVSPGTLERARKVVELGRVWDELALTLDTLHNLEKQGAGVLSERLRVRMGQLQVRVSQLREEIDGAAT